MNVFFIVHLLLGVHIVPATSSDIPAPEAHATVPEDAIAGWGRLHDIVRTGDAITGIRGRYRYRKTTVSGETKRVEEETIEFGSSSDGMYLREGAVDVNEVAAVNAEYGFGANKPSPEARLEVKQIRRGQSAEQMKALMRDRWEPLLFSGIEIAGITMSDLVSSERFKLISWHTDADGLRGEMQFQYDRNNERSESALTGGTVRFSGASDWGIERFDCTTFWGRMEGDVKYRPFDGSFVPASTDVRMYDGMDNLVVHQTFELLEIEVVAEAEMPVRLEDYGLSAPKPELQEGQPFEVHWVWILNGAFLLMLLSYYLWRRSGGRKGSMAS